MYKPNLLLRNLWLLFGWIALLPLVVIACKLSGTNELSAPAVLDTPVYAPAAAAVSPTPAALDGQAGAAQETGPAQADVPVLAPTPACTNNLAWLEDLSIPDGSIVQPGEALDKRWKVQNNGSCSWDQDYRVKLVGGPDLGAPEEQALYPARAGADALVRMIFTAPVEPGAYRSAWQAYTPDGAPFGDPFYVDFIVAAP